MKILFAGTPEFAVLPLENIIKNGFDVVGVVTQADKPQGRKGVLTPPPVKVFALEKGIPVFQPAKIKEEISALKAFGADIMVTCAYGQILTQEVLDCFPKGVWNIHAGLLPFYRGASPIQSCIINGERETGVSIMQTELGLDCGDILCVKKTEILESETYGQLSERLSAIGAELIVEGLKMLEKGEYTLEKQASDGVNVVRKINKEQGKIDFSKSAKEIVDLVRGMNPAPIAYMQSGEVKINVYLAEKATLTDEEQAVWASAVCGEVISDKVKRGLLIKCADGAVKLLQAQASGGKVMSGSDLLNGRKVQKGQVFSC
ncbi:MAG: methionyl-tRNA formyltransferase [Clostridiales bacterium]|nr:methionyl-tRNA formyltransferase [Clostridiales bacterium]